MLLKTTFRIQNYYSDMSYTVSVLKFDLAGKANAKPYPHRDIRASRGKRKPDMNTIESCFQFNKS